MGLMIQSTFILLLTVLITQYLEIDIFKKTPIITDTLEDEYDYIIVGGGTAGSVMAARLSEDEDKTVLLLEAGGHYDQNPNFFIPIHWYSLQETEHDWGFFTESQQFSNFAFKENRNSWPRGRVLGGSSTINAMQYTRGSKYDFDEWAQNGCNGWSFKDVLPYFLKSEDVQIDDFKSSKYHSTGGPVAVSHGRVTPLAEMYMQAGQELGYKLNDYNGKDQEGFSYTQLLVRNGVRSNVGVEYLENTGNRNNLHIAIRSYVTNIEIQNQAATGVFFIRNGRKHFIKARKEVILSAGAIQSPQILMLSGIGPKDHLMEHGIEAKADLPVGKNLQDHQLVSMNTKINHSLGITEDLKNSYWTKIKYYVYGKGPLAISGNDGSAFLYIDEGNRGKRSVEIQLAFFSSYAHVNHFNYKQELVNEYFAKDGNVNGFNTFAINTRPRSHGEVKLKSKDPFDHPSIDPRYFSDPEDVKDFIEGIRIWEKLMETKTFKALGVEFNSTKLSFCSEHEFRSNAYWDCFVRHISTTSYHPCCTVKMGSTDDPSAVLDSSLKVKGVHGLRVIDASIFPNITVGNIQAPTVMVAEKIADGIRGIDSVEAFRKQLSRDT